MSSPTPIPADPPVTPPGPVIGPPTPVAPPGPVIGPPVPLPAPAPTPPAPSWIQRMKLSEPVRLYLYSVLGVVVAGLALAGILTGAWVPYTISAGATVLGLVPAAEAARASSYSTAGALRAIARAAGPVQAGQLARGLDL